MQARSALFDLYGDHLRPRGGAAPVAAVVRLLEPVGIGAPAVRTAISRMVKEGWLEPVQTGGGRGYRTTERANRRIDATTERVYRRDRRRWDGHWHLVLLSTAGQRTTRTRLRADLRFLGYADLGGEVWVSPFASRELPAVLERAGATARTARADHVEPPPTTAWDLEGLHAAYSGWLATAERLVDDRLGVEALDPDRAAFAARFHLVHEWRKFLFADPGLPDELLPPEWPGRAAGALFTDLADWLRPGTDRFVARCLGD
jgi:phenylacetic acid degradation operon negative regulatory protein